MAGARRRPYDGRFRAPFLETRPVTEWLLLLLALLLVLACGVFVAAEFSFVTVDRAAVDLAVERGEAGARGVQRALGTLSTQLSGAQVGITLTNLAIGYLAEPALASLLREPLTCGLGCPGPTDAGEDRAPSAIALGAGARSSPCCGARLVHQKPRDRPRRWATARLTQGSAARPSTRRSHMPYRAISTARPMRILRRLGVETAGGAALDPIGPKRAWPRSVRHSADEGVMLVGHHSPRWGERSIAFGDRTRRRRAGPPARTGAVTWEERATVIEVVGAAAGDPGTPGSR
jgi:hypothetical protein